LTYEDMSEWKFPIVFAGANCECTMNVFTVKMHGSMQLFCLRRRVCMQIFYKRYMSLSHTCTMDKAKIRPLATPKSFNRSSQKLADMVTSWTALGMQNSVAIVLGVFALLIRDFDVLQG